MQNMFYDDQVELPTTTEQKTADPTSKSKSPLTRVWLLVSHHINKTRQLV